MSIAFSRLLCDIAKMRLTLLSAVAVLSAGVFPALPETIAPDPGLTLDATVIRVIDGDTLVVESRVQYHVRLIDCWAPESRTSDLAEKQRGLRSKARMVQLADGKPVRIHVPIGTDLTQVTSLSRVLGRAWLNVDGVPESRDLSEIMVSEGLATKTKVVTE